MNEVYQDSYSSINITYSDIQGGWTGTGNISSDPLFVGGFGSHGTRHGNFAVQNADFILSVGARLDVRETCSFATFAREAAKVIVDIDPHELEKFPKLGMRTDALIQADARRYLEALLDEAARYEKRDISRWLKKIEEWKGSFPICPRDYYEEEALNPYVFVKTLSRASQEGDVIFVDTGCSIAWMMQAYEFKKGQRLFHDFNNTAMGYALPASIGASLALGRKQVICVTGDGSLQMNLQELATVIRHGLPVKIFLVNNRGYTMIQQTQDQWLNSEYEASTLEGGLAFPDFVKLGKAYGYRTFSISRNKGLLRRIKEILEMEGPVFCNLEFADYHRVTPQVKFGRAMEDGEPLLERSEFLKQMIVAPDPASL